MTYDPDELERLGNHPDIDEARNQGRLLLGEATLRYVEALLDAAPEILRDLRDLRDLRLLMRTNDNARAAAQERVLALESEARDAADRQRRAIAVLRQVEWNGAPRFSGSGYCPSCHYNGTPHAPDCALAALLEGR